MNNIDKDKYTELFNGGYSQFYATALLLMQNEEDAYDLVQETALLTYKNISTLKDICYFKTWATRILINTAKKTYKKKKNHFELLDKICILNNQKNIDKYIVEDYIIIKESLTCLKQGEKDLIIMRYFLDYKIKEISKIFKIPQGTVKSRLNRIINKLKKYLEVHEYVK